MLFGVFKIKASSWFDNLIYYCQAALHFFFSPVWLKVINCSKAKRIKWYHRHKSELNRPVADCHLNHWVWWPEIHINLLLTFNLSNLSKKSKNEITNFSESMSQAPLSCSSAHRLSAFVAVSVVHRSAHQTCTLVHVCSLAVQAIHTSFSCSKF